MRTRKIVLSGVIVGVLTVFGLSLALAQDAQRAPRGGRGRRTPEQMRQRMMERIKERLEAGDEEWKVLQPKLEKVMTLSREAGSGGGLRMLFGGRGGRRGGATANAATQPESAVAKAVRELQQTLENKEATPEQIKAKLTALRTAREKVKQELAKARAALQELVTQRQEAVLVLMGTLN